MVRLAATPAQEEAILGAMWAIARTRGDAAVTLTDRTTVEAAARIVFGHADVGAETLPAVGPTELARAVKGGLAEDAVRLLTVTALVDGTLDAAKIDRVSAYAKALGAGRDYVEELAQAAHGHLQDAMGHMIRDNMGSITNQPWTKGVTDDVAAYLLPYREGRTDPALAARFASLAGLPADSFGQHFWRHFRVNGYAFPGEADGLNARFSVPHDSAHVLAGYDTTPGGEILVSTFTAAMHPKNAMSAHVLPVIMSWHLGIKFNDVAKSASGTLAPAAFFEAWERGAAINTDLFADGWDFWAVTATALDELRRVYAIPPRRE